MRRIRCGAAPLVVVVGLWAGVAAGRFARPDYVPAERLIENAAAYIREEPNDASAYYILARIHYLAFVNKAFLAGTFDERRPSSLIPHWWWGDYLSGARRAEATRVALVEFGLESVADLTSENRSRFYDRVRAVEDQLRTQGWQPPQPGQEQLLGHAAAAQWNFYQAIARDPNSALYYLGQASLGEQYAEYFNETSPVLMPAPLRTIVWDSVKQTYLAAYELAIQEDLAREHRPIGGLGEIVSYEAGNAYVRLWEAEMAIPPDAQETIAAIKANLATLGALPLGPITPVVFSLDGGISLADLLAPARVVQFDLDGDGVVERRPWVRSTTGFLAWDGNGDGRITSGRELFGSVTWWLLFPNGYRALDLLDDNRDGCLSGTEFRGLSVWFDRNSNGTSDAGEVVSTDRLGIAAISTRPTGWDGESPMHAAGIRLKDGRTVPSYDWIARPADARPEARRRLP